jgi:hypothetical protein
MKTDYDTLLKTMRTNIDEGCRDNLEIVTGCHQLLDNFRYHEQMLAEHYEYVKEIESEANDALKEEGVESAEAVYFNFFDSLGITYEDEFEDLRWFAIDSLRITAFNAQYRFEQIVYGERPDADEAGFPIPKENTYDELRILFKDYSRVVETDYMNAIDTTASRMKRMFNPKQRELALYDPHYPDAHKIAA